MGDPSQSRLAPVAVLDGVQQDEIRAITLAFPAKTRRRFRELPCLSDAW